jgi:hypothetical protein
MWNIGDRVWFSVYTEVHDGEVIGVNEHSIDVAYCREGNDENHQYSGLAEIHNGYPIFKTEAEAIQSTIAQIQSEILQPLHDRLAQLSQPPLTEGKTYVLFHTKKVRPFIPCMDGLFAAYAAKMAMLEAVLVPAMYEARNAPEIDFHPEDTIYLLDLTYPAPVLNRWAATGAKLIILDHHKSAAEDLIGITDRIDSVFDMARSGAMIAWDYFHPGQRPPQIFRYVQDRDLWQKQLPDCDLVHVGLVEAIDELSLEDALSTIAQIDDDVDFYREAGKKAKVEIDAAIQDAIANVEIRNVLGYTVPFYRCRTKRDKQCYSDIGNELLKVKVRRSLFGAPIDPPFAVIKIGQGWSLRTRNGLVDYDGKQMDVSAIARMLGGGGHQNASGIRGY